MRLKTTEDRMAARRIYLPKLDVTTTITEESGLGVVYVWPYVRGTDKKLYYAATAFAGTAAKPSFNCLFRTDKDLDRKIEEFFTGLREHKARLAQWKAERAKPHTFKIGDVVVNSWGYDQTNVDWYRVVKTTDRYVWLQPIAGQTEAAEGYSPMAGMSTPAIDTTSDDPAKWGFSDARGNITKHMATGDHCTMRHGCGSKWDGRAKYESWYA